MAGVGAAAIIGYVGTAISAAAAIAQGEAAAKRAKAQAERLRLEAIQEGAVAQQKSVAVRKQSALISSKAQSLLAASGGDVSGPGAEKIFGDIAAEGEYRAQLAMYEGDSRAATLRGAAEDKIAEGRAAQTGGYISAASTVMSGLGSDDSSALFDRYSSKKRGAIRDSSDGWYVSRY
jgi:hypothetical protein